MKPANPAPDGRKTPAARQQPQGQPSNTPNSDMQAEDTGNAASADSGDSGDSATAAARAMKQTSKTPAESGNKR